MDGQLDLNTVAERYICLVLSMGRHDPDYVDAYYGPLQFKEESDRLTMSLENIQSETRAILYKLQTATPPPGGSTSELRYHYLRRQLESLVTRTEMLLGKKFSFDAESQALYDAAPPAFPESHFQTILEELGSLLGGKGFIPSRLETYRTAFVIPPSRLDSVFKAAIAESRLRTMRHITLPDAEQFVLEYVTEKSWSGYNWYLGSYRSLIQINTDLPIYIDRAIDLASHEGYPGHHVYNALLESDLVRRRGWMEFTVYALFSPQSLIAEGTANYGIVMAFPFAERIAFEHEVLFPLAGLDPQRVEEYYQIHDRVQQLSYAGNEAARGYLDGKLSREQAEDWLVRYSLMSPERASQRIRFFDQYRSYVINYNLGQDLVRRYIDFRCGSDTRAQRRWEEFKLLLSSPLTPSALVV